MLSLFPDFSIFIALLPWPKELANVMPFVSGKIVLAILTVLSAVAWGIIISKQFKLRTLIRADRHFGSGLRKTGRCLELYEHQMVYPESPLYQVYLAGAKSTALEMVGDQRPEFLAKTQLASSNTLSSDQMSAISAAFDDGFRKGLQLMQGGFDLLRNIALTAIGLGVVSSVYFMIRALNEFEYALVRMLIASLVMVVAAFLVALPTEWYRLKLKALYQRRLDKMIRFHYGINLTFAKHLQKGAPAPKSKVSATMQDAPNSINKEASIGVMPKATVTDPLLKLPELEKQKPRYFSLSKSEITEDDIG